MVTTDDTALQAVLAGDFARWQVFLHPLQRKIVERSYNGPARVSGGPGTGKTIVALHRVKHLVDRLPPGDGKDVLFTTFNKSLAADLRSRLLELAGREILERVDVVNIDSLASKVVAEAEPRSRGTGWTIRGRSTCGMTCCSSWARSAGTPGSCTMNGRRSCSGKPSAPGKSTSAPAARAGEDPEPRTARGGLAADRAVHQAAHRTQPVDVPPGSRARRADREGTGPVEGDTATGTSWWTRPRI